MQVDFLDGDPVHSRFGLDQGLEHAQGPGLDPPGKPAALDNLANLPQSSMPLSPGVGMRMRVVPA
jgi:hypothetical protein